MIKNYNLFDDTMDSLIRRALHVKVKDVMRPVQENIDENTPLPEAVHKMVMLRVHRMPVSRAGKIIGVLRLADLVAEVGKIIEDISADKIVAN